MGGAWGRGGWVFNLKLGEWLVTGNYRSGKDQAQISGN